MEEITLEDFRGIWLGNEFDLVVGLYEDINYGSLVVKSEKRIIETRDLELLPITENNTRVLRFNNQFSIEIWRWNKPELTIRIVNDDFELLHRGFNS